MSKVKRIKLADPQKSRLLSASNYTRMGSEMLFKCRRDKYLDETTYSADLISPAATQDTPLHCAQVPSHPPLSPALPPKTGAKSGSTASKPPAPTPAPPSTSTRTETVPTPFPSQQGSL